MEKLIGQKIRELRKRKRISQMDLAERIGLSFQQIQKYEKGISKISVSRLQQIAKALNVDVCIFFEEESNKNSHIMEHKEKYVSNPCLDKRERELISLFRSIDNKMIKEGIILLLKGIVEQNEK